LLQLSCRLHLPGARSTGSSRTFHIRDQSITSRQSHFPHKASWPEQVAAVAIKLLAVRIERFHAGKLSHSETALTVQPQTADPCSMPTGLADFQQVAFKCPCGTHVMNEAEIRQIMLEFARIQKGGRWGSRNVRDTTKDRRPTELSARSALPRGPWAKSLI